MLADSTTRTAANRRRGALDLAPPKTAVAVDDASRHRRVTAARLSETSSKRSCFMASRAACRNDNIHTA
jgi:hypothetical protein